MMNNILRFLALFFFLVLTSCASKKAEKTVETEYIKAFKKLENKYYIDAAEDFEKLIEDYPFSSWSLKGQVMAIYAYYKEENYVKMVSNIDNFISLNPTSNYNDYLLYMKGLAYYNQIPSIHRSQDISKKSYSVYMELINRYPKSKYSFDAQSRLDFIIEHIAGGIMDKARFQAQQKNYIGSINNFLSVIENYPNSKQIPEAYFRLAEIYTKLGIKSKANIFLQKLQSEHSGTFWNRIGQKLKDLT